MDPISQVAHVDERRRIEELPVTASRVNGHNVTAGRADPVVATACHIDASLDGPTERRFIAPLAVSISPGFPTMMDPSSTAPGCRRFDLADSEDSSIDAQDAVEPTPRREISEFAVRVLCTKPLVTVQYDPEHKEILVCKELVLTPQVQKEIDILKSREVFKAVEDANGCIVETVDIIECEPRVVNGVVTTSCVVKMRPCSSITLPEPASSTDGLFPPMSGDGFTLARWFVLKRASLRPEDVQACHRVFMVCFRDVAIGLKALHAQQLAHRDIKLENFVYAFEPQQQPSLAGIGQEETVAQWLGRHRVRAQIIDLGFVTPACGATHPCGTLSYIPPDLYKFYGYSFSTGRQHVLTPTIEQLQSADMFALGIAFANMLMGQCPQLKLPPRQSLVQQLNAARAEMAARVERYASFLQGDGCPHEFWFLSGLVTPNHEPRLTAAADALQHVMEALSQQGRE